MSTTSEEANVPRLVLRKSVIPNWYAIEIDRPGRAALPPRAHELLLLGSVVSTRLGPKREADVEGTRAEMVAIARAILAGGEATFERCAAWCEGGDVLFSSSRNSLEPGRFPRAVADDFARRALAELGEPVLPAEAETLPALDEGVSAPPATPAEAAEPSPRYLMTEEERAAVRAANPASRAPEFFPNLEFHGREVRPGHFHERSFTFSSACRVRSLKLPRGLALRRVRLALGPGEVHEWRTADDLPSDEKTKKRALWAGTVESGGWKGPRVVPAEENNVSILLYNTTEEPIRADGLWTLEAAPVAEPVFEEVLTREEPRT